MCLKWRWNKTKSKDSSEKQIKQRPPVYEMVTLKTDAIKHRSNGRENIKTKANTAYVGGNMKMETNTAYGGGNMKMETNKQYVNIHVK